MQVNDLDQHFCETAILKHSNVQKRMVGLMFLSMFYFFKFDPYFKLILISLPTWQAALTLAGRPRPEARQPITWRKVGAGARRELGRFKGWEEGMVNGDVSSRSLVKYPVGSLVNKPLGSVVKKPVRAAITVALNVSPAPRVSTSPPGGGKAGTWTRP